MQIIRQSDFIVTPWKNGGGVTREACRVPPGGDPFLWRLSVAQIDSSGPFSDFAAYNRTMVLLRGSGVDLKCANGERYRLRNIGDLIEFDGAMAMQCALEAGPCVDLNLIAAKSLRTVHARVHRLQEPLAVAAHGASSTLIVPIDATVVVRSAGGDVTGLEPWDLGVLSARSGELTLAPPTGSAPALVFLATLSEA
jgi:environmental stress-induced protein Ves